MSLSISNDSKNNLDVTNTDKTGSEITWDDADWSWDDSGSSTWDNPRRVLAKEDKNNLTISNESKN